jgi:hypothetical protein
VRIGNREKRPKEMKGKEEMKEEREGGIVNKEERPKK